MRVLTRISFLLLFTECLGAQPSGETFLPLVVDFARFEAEGRWNYVELYVSIPRDRLDFREAGGGYEARYVFGYEVLHGDSTVANDSWSGIDRVDSTDAVQGGQRINDQASFFLEEGSYRLSVVVRDLIGGGIGSYETDLEIKSFSDAPLGMSDIQLGLRISRTQEKGRFVKNGLSVVPNPQGMYTMAWPILYYYVEIYDAFPPGAGDSTYSVFVRLEGDGEVVREMPPKSLRRSGPAVVDVGSSIVSNLSSGTYTLAVDVVDEAAADTVSREKTFYVYRPSDFRTPERSIAEARKRSGPGFDTMTEGALDSLFERFSYIVREEEKSVFSGLNLDGKRRFLTEFWDSRDADPATPGNEAMVEYMTRVAYATQAFAWGKREGWRTDMGRVYIVYGPPDDVLRFPNSSSERPYQIWYYHELDSGVEFVFVDRTGFGDMILVHSTARSEVQDYAWIEKWLQ